MSWTATHLDTDTPPKHLPEAEGHEGLWRLEWSDDEGRQCMTIFLWLKDDLWRAKADHKRSGLGDPPVSPVSHTPIVACGCALMVLSARLKDKTALVDEIDMAREDLRNAPLPRRPSA
ncbi:MAG: hypothetical protein ACE366_16340 [Bradymonadia bacterium]